MGLFVYKQNLEGRTVLSTANRDHARNAYHHWDKMMQLCSQEVQAYAKKSTQLEAEWAALRNGKMVYFNSAKVAFYIHLFGHRIILY